MFGVTIDQAQQGVDVDARALVGSGQQVHSLAQAGQMMAQDGFELTGMSEGELPQ